MVANLFRTSAPNWEDRDQNYPLTYEILNEENIALGTRSFFEDRELILLDESNVGEHFRKTLKLRVYDTFETYREIVSNVEVFPERFDLAQYEEYSKMSNVMQFNQTMYDQYIIGSYASWMLNNTLAL